MYARLLCVALGLCLLLSVSPHRVAAQTTPPADHQADALTPPPPPPSLAGVDARGPSQYMAGSVAVRVVLPESVGHGEDWSAAQIAQVRAQIEAGLDWWAARLPAARLSFTVELAVVPTSYEPIEHGLSEEGRWIGDVLGRLGYTGGSYFDQAYSAGFDLRDSLNTDWATTIFVVNSSRGASYFPDGRFAYAYISGPFMVLTSDVGAYGAERMAPVVAHELGHLFGALDQYAAAGVECGQTSGYLNTPTTNSQYQGCGTSLPSIMLETLSSFSQGQVDPSALAQIGYRDSDHDGLIDPLDTAPAISLNEALTAAPDGQPILSGESIDAGFPSPFQPIASINRVSAVEYRVDGGVWQPAAAEDGAFDNSAESFSSLLPLYDGDYTVEVRARNSVGALSAARSLSVRVRQVGPQPDYRPSAPAFTAKPLVSVQLGAPPATRAVQISADPSFGGAPWQPYAPSLPFTLSPHDGAQALYVRYKDGEGRPSLPYALSVRLDTTPPVGSASRDPDHAERLLLRAHDDGAGVAYVGLQIGEGAPLWLPFEANIQLDAVGASAEAALQASSPLSVRFRDAAGNVSSAYVVSEGERLYLPLILR